MEYGVLGLEAVKLKKLSYLFNVKTNLFRSNGLDIRISLLDGLVSEHEELQYKGNLIKKLVEQDIEMISFPTESTI